MRRKKHEIELAEMDGYSFTEIIASSANKNGSKRLQVNFHCGQGYQYEVLHNKKSVIETSILDLAIEVYNDTDETK